MLFSFSAVGCTSQRMFVLAIVGAAFLCYVFISVVDVWAKPAQTRLRPQQISSPPEKRIVKGDDSNVEQKNREAEYEARVSTVRQVCEKDEVAMLRRVWRVAANRRWGKKAYCKTRTCPIIIDEEKVLFFCFIPQVASTRVKEFFLNISGIPLNDTVTNNRTALHILANNYLRRISPMYYPATTARRFYKIMFVEHPFDRLVSAFRSKAEAPREDIQYYYDTYWDRVMRKVRGNQTVDLTSKLTFPEFIWYLRQSLEREYDENWAPYWSRCDPCLVDYDFIGKMETSADDFQYAFNKVGIPSSREWWAQTKPIERALTLAYFSKIPQKDIEELYQIYRLDFELFGYTLDGFLRELKVVLAVV